ncbi:hypothetical protein [Streptomyces sp. NPDC057690]|uniref:hypothetical protein n=1 Tax=Streptomyces sp. NPDC057690 TaxID=3346214 RepID=UPI003679619A
MPAVYRPAHALPALLDRNTGPDQAPAVKVPARRQEQRHHDRAAVVFMLRGPLRTHR